jgi:hypothetical protein
MAGGARRDPATLLDGIEATPAVTTEPDTAGTQVLILTTFDLDDYVYRALRAGPADSCSRTPPRDRRAPAHLGRHGQDACQRLPMKLDVHDRAQLVMIAYETRLVTPG